MRPAAPTASVAPLAQPLRKRAFGGKLARMSELVNLRLARKRKARAHAESKAAEQRARFGRPKGERLRAKREEELEGRRLDAKRLVREER